MQRSEGSQIESEIESFHSAPAGPSDLAATYMLQRAMHLVVVGRV